MLLLLGIAIDSAQASFSTQNSDSTLRLIRATPHFGLVIPHHQEMTYFINDFSYGIDLNFGIKKYNKSWYKYTNFPELGFGVFYNSFGNGDVFGSSISGYGYIQPNLFRTTRWSLDTKYALGLGYASNPFDESENPYNHVFGSDFNVFIGVGLFGKYNITNSWTISGNINYNHLSNGSLKKPNHGINTITLGIGIGYNFSNINNPESIQAKRAPRSNARDILIFFSVGSSQRSVYKPTNYPAFSLNINHVWWVSKKSGWGFGADGIFYGAAPYEYQIDNNQFIGEEEFDNLDKIYGGLFLSYNYRFNTTQLFAHVGTYLLYGIEPKQKIYPRLGIRQQIYKNLYANFSIKASFFKAEFIEFGLGYRVNYKKNSL